MDTAPDALQDEPPHPQRLAFVLKLHRSCCAPRHAVRGRVEHPASGRRAVFEGWDQLQAWLEQQIDAESGPAAPGSTAPRPTTLPPR